MRMILSREVLQALLSPDASQRTQAEAFLSQNLVGPEQRCRAYLEWLLVVVPQEEEENARSSTNAATTTSGANLPHLQLLAAVLLRREILKLDSVELLQQMVDPLLCAFFQHGRSSNSLSRSSCGSIIGDCLAAVCQGLSFLTSTTTTTTAKDVCQHIFQAIGTLASQGNVDCLQLLVELARSSPLSFCEVVVPRLPQLVSTVLMMMQQNTMGGTTTTAPYKVLAQLIVQASVAVTVASTTTCATAASLAVTAASCCYAASSSRVRGRAEEQEDVDHPSDSSSPAAQLGESCLLPLLLSMTMMMQQHQPQQQQHSNSSSLLLLEPLLYGSDAIPSLFVRPAVWNATVNYMSVAILQQQQQAQVVSAPQQEQDVVHEKLQAIQVVATLLEVLPQLKHQATTANNSMTTFLEACLVTCLQTMSLTRHCCCALEEQEEDNNNNMMMEEEELREHGLFAENLLESMVHSVGPSALNVVLQQVAAAAAAHQQQQAHHSNANTNSFRAALAALRCCAWATPTSMSPHARTAAEMALSAVAAVVNNNKNHHNGFLQCEATVLLGVLVEKYSDIRQEYAPRILAALAETLSSPASSASLLTLACRAIVSFCRGGGGDSSSSHNNKSSSVEPALVLTHMPALMSSLVLLLNQQQQQRQIRVQIQAISTIACLAQVVESEFVGYYPTVMPFLLQTLGMNANTARSSSSRSTSSFYYASELRGSAVEAASIIGQAVDDADMFAPDAERILQLAAHVLQQQQQQSANTKSEDYISLDALLSACARIASVLKDAYAPYVGVVLPHLLQRATDPSDVEISEGIESGLDASKQGQVEMDDETGSESMTVSLPGRGLTKVTIHTSKIHDKSVAVRALYEHATALEASFGPWCQTCFDALGSLVTFKYSADLRGTSAQTLAAVFESACSSGETFGMEIPSRYLAQLVTSISKQIVHEDILEMETLYAQAEALSLIHYSVHKRLEAHGSQMLAQYSVIDANSVVECCMMAIVACLKRRGKITSAMSGLHGSLAVEDEIEEYEQMLLREEELLTPLVDSVGFNLKFFRQDFVGIFERLVAPVLGPYLTPGNDVRARVAAVCLFDDSIEHCGLVAASKFARILVDGAVLGIEDDCGDSDLLRSCIYGIAQICRYAPSSVLLPFEDRIVSHLLSIVTGNRDEDEAVFENAVSALASLTLFGTSPVFKNSQHVSLDQMIEMFLVNCPLTVDLDESKFCNAGLCDLVDKGIIRLDASRCSELMRIIGDVMAMVDDGEEVATGETCLRFASILFRMQQEVPRDVLQQCFAALSPDGQAALQKTMGQYAHQLGAVVTP